MSIDRFLSRRRGPAYDCLAFAREVWRDLTGEDLRARLDGLFVRSEERRPAPHHFRSFERLERPESPCLVLMRGRGVEPHMGVYLRGSVANLRDQAEFLPLGIATRGYSIVEYYR